MIDGFPLSFFLPLVVHVLAGLMTGVTGIMAFCAPKRPSRHHRWGTDYVWAYTVVFLTATMLSVQRWQADAYLFFLAVIGYGLALCGYGARRFWQEPRVGYMPGKQWGVVHVVGMIGSYVVLWTAFLVDNAQRIPGLNQLPPLTFWVLPSLIGLPFLIVSLSRFAPQRMVPARRPGLERKEENDMRGQNQGLPSHDESQPDSGTLVVPLEKVDRTSLPLARGKADKTIKL